MTRTIPVLPQPYGIRVRLRPGDPFAKLVGGDWQKTHWYFTAAERDRMLEDRDAHAKVLAAPYDRDKAERARIKFVEIQGVIDAIDRAIGAE